MYHLIYTASTCWFGQNMSHDWGDVWIKIIYRRIFRLLVLFDVEFFATVYVLRNLVEELLTKTWMCNFNVNVEIFDYDKLTKIKVERGEGLLSSGYKVADNWVLELIVVVWLWFGFNYRNRIANADYLVKSYVELWFPWLASGTSLSNVLEWGNLPSFFEE